MRLILSMFLSLLLCIVTHVVMASEPSWQALREGGGVVLLRHAQTEPGVGDPPGFRLDDCSSQRQLSAQGREQARRIGERFRDAGIQPVAVFSSAWCRSRETAQLAFPQLPVRHLSALDSFFDDPSQRAQRVTDMRQALRDVAPGSVIVWVSHQVNVTALTGEVPAMGEGFVLRPEGERFRFIGRLPAEGRGG